MIKVFIVDDHEIIRKGIRMIIQEEADIKVVSEADNGDDAIEKMKFIDFDIMLLDLDMPKKHGFSLITELKKINPNLKVLILSIFPEDPNALRAIKAGASGYLNKSVALEELVIAIREIHKRGKYLSEKLIELLAFEIESNEKESFHTRKLSNREYQVMISVVNGKTTKEISEELSLSITTIIRFKSFIHKKLNVKNDAELIQYAIYNNIIENKKEAF